MELKKRSTSAFGMIGLPPLFSPPARKRNSRFLTTVARSLPLPVLSVRSISFAGSSPIVASRGVFPPNAPGGRVNTRSRTCFGVEPSAAVMAAGMSRYVTMTIESFFEPSALIVVATPVAASRSAMVCGVPGKSAEKPSPVKVAHMPGIPTWAIFSILSNRPKVLESGFVTGPPPGIGGFTPPGGIGLPVPPGGAGLGLPPGGVTGAGFAPGLAAAGVSPGGAATVSVGLSLDPVRK